MYDKPDFWSQKARQEGYPARSVYKLKEIDEKFGLFRQAARPRVLDLGAAPGSWSLYILRKFPLQPDVRRGGSSGPDASGRRPGFLLAAADLLPLPRRFDKGLFDREDFVFIQGDFTLPENREILRGYGPFTVLLSDAAPATSGSRTLDTLRSLALAEDALNYADLALERGGSFTVKVFQGGQTAELFSKLKERFTAVKTFKPKACRSDSFETYCVALGKK